MKRLVLWGGAVLVVLASLAALALLNKTDVEPWRAITQPEAPSPAPEILDDQPVVQESDDSPGPAETPIVQVDRPTPESPVDPKPEPAPPVESPPELAAEKIVWTRIDGLLAGRGVAQPYWSGVAAEWELNGESELALLPGSRAEGRLPGGTGILLDGDSRIRLRPEVRTLPRMTLEWGRVALLDLAAGTMLPAPFADAVETLQVERDGTSIALEKAGSGGRLVVLSGELSVEARRLGPRAALEWQGPGNSAGVAAAGPPDWLEAGASPGLPDERLAALAASDDVAGELEATLREASAGEAGTIVAWNLALAPEPAILSSLHGETHEVRVAALDWLADIRDDDPRRGAAWRAFAGSLNEPETARQIVGWFRATHEPSRADRQLFAELLGGLDHPELSVREMADFCLRRITGLDVARYRADADPAERRQGIARWRNVIARAAGGRSRGNTPRDRRR